MLGKFLLIRSGFVGVAVVQNIMRIIKVIASKFSFLASHQHRTLPQTELLLNGHVHR